MVPGIEGMEDFSVMFGGDTDEYATGDSPPSQSDYDTLNALFPSTGHNGLQSQQPFTPVHLNAFQTGVGLPDMFGSGPGSNNVSLEDSTPGSSRPTRETWSAKANSNDTPMTDFDDSGDIDFDQFVELDTVGDRKTPRKTVDPKLLRGHSEEMHLGSPDGISFKHEAPSPEHVKPNSARSPTGREARTAILPKASPVSPGAAHRGHQKAVSQNSFTQSMPDLLAEFPREVSPMGSLAFSQTGSPLAAPNPFAMNMNFATSIDHPNLAHGLPMADPSNPTTQLHQPLNPFQPFGSLHSMQQAMGVTHFDIPQQQMTFGSSQAVPKPPTLLLGIKDHKFKSRVETQLITTLSLAPWPAGIKRLHLPKHTIGKAKFFKPDESAPDMLELHVKLVRTSSMRDDNNLKKALARAAAPTKQPTPDQSEEETKNGDDDLRICKTCMVREKKRASRKKNNKEPEYESLWNQLEGDRIILFNEAEIQEWKEEVPIWIGPHEKPSVQGGGHITVPMRICCYCRHHDERQGYQVIFTLKDWQGNFVAQNITDSIMITDDHKTQPGAPVAAQNNAAQTNGSQSNASAQATPPSSSSQNTLHGSQSTQNIQAMHMQVPATSSNSSPPLLQPNLPAVARNLSRPPSPNSIGMPIAKKRKPSGSKVPSELAMTRLETSAPHQSATMPSPFTPNRSPHASVAGPFPVQAPGQMGNQVMLGDSTDPFFALYNRSLSREPEVPGQGYSASPSNHTSRASSPGVMLGVSPTATLPLRNLQGAMLSAQGNVVPAPTIHRVVPSEGSKSGAYEVTILGTHFHPGVEVMFGDQTAIATTYWGERSLLAIVPAAETAGLVNVTLRHPNGQAALAPGHKFTAFKYLDDDEHELMRTALAVLSKKWGSSDIPGVARHIINSSGWNSSGQGAGGSSGSGGNGFSGFTQSRSTLESQLLRVCELVDIDDSATKAHWNLKKKKTGQTMLHLASSMGFQRLVAGLLARGANPDVRDNAGYTPMHLAALNKHPEIVRRLVYAGADPTFRTLSGLTPAEMAPGMVEVLAATRSLQGHSRSRSATSLHSRASSAASLRSLWEPAETDPLTAEYKVDSAESSGEGLEKSQPATSEEEEDVEEAEWLDMRRSSIHSRRAQDLSPTPIVPTTDELVPAALASPAIATLREQLTHLQHFVSQQFPNLNNMQNPLPDSYRPYFNTGALQRISALVPSIGARPGSPGSKEIEGKWWDLTSLIPNYNAPPPAYEEIFPGQDLMDTKQATAAGAAAEAEADAKCAALFEQPSTTDEAIPSTSKSAKMATSSGLAKPESAIRARELPKILQIGPKNKIPTKEEQEAFRREHSKVQKSLSADKKLFWVWIPILSIMLLAMLSSWFPGLLDTGAKIFSSGTNVVRPFRTPSTETHNPVINHAA